MTLAKATIAVVDDDVGMLESLEDLLESSGYKTIKFTSAEALLEAGLRRFDLVIADIGMPAMDGFELRDIARQQRPDLRVFLMTGRHELSERGRSKGIVPLFRKPFDAPALIEAIGVALATNVAEDDHDDA
ncbi:response regulator [Devosia sp. Root105]|uniref:response regulator n=1 Tax=Devosia sp. Root105 TaxID=1736423 RepID=UPI000B28C683|nr:response regulator [Devosia sp. Root105]